MENSLEEFKRKCRFELAEKRIDECEGGKMEITESEKQKGQRWKKSEQSSKDLLATM